jgi:zinc-ribbon domain
MSIGIAFAISLALAVFVAYPLLSTAAEGRSTLPIDVTPLGDLKRRRLVLYENIQDLEFEYQAKKIARDDYESLRESYTAEAARLITQAQEIERSSPEDVFIEQEVALRRAQRRILPKDEYVCPKCGFENPLPVKFCGDCGARLGDRGQGTGNR